MRPRKARPDDNECFSFSDEHHPKHITFAGSAPKGWVDEFRFAPYVRKDIYSAMKAERDALREALNDVDMIEQAISDMSEATSNPRDLAEYVVECFADAALAKTGDAIGEIDDATGLSCSECGHFIVIDAIVEHDIWKAISPTHDEGGCLCANCMCDRLASSYDWPSVRLTNSADNKLKPKWRKDERHDKG